jgi:hypothetical protein
MGWGAACPFILAKRPILGAPQHGPAGLLRAPVGGLLFFSEAARHLYFFRCPPGVFRCPPGVLRRPPSVFRESNPLTGLLRGCLVQGRSCPKPVSVGPYEVVRLGVMRIIPPLAVSK